MKKVVVGMSGGVDSSVAAILLKQQGYEVIGLFMRNWDSSINNDILGNPTLNNQRCPQEDDYNDALKVCQKLNIVLHRVDFIKEYWDYVFTYFLEELKLGRTPNPDLMCNKYIKFDMFVKEAKKLGADCIATGHYAKLENGKLLKGIDKNKDQTYFLAQINKDQLKNVLFPIGDYEKSKIREIAKEYDLVTAEKKDSTGICFIGERKISKFLENYLPNNPGDIVDIASNKIVGTHIGLMYYTIGQRKGLNLGGFENKTFVVGKDMQNNKLLISTDETYLESDYCIIDNLNLLKDNVTNCQAKFRYRQPDIEVKLTYIDDKIKVQYDKVKSVTPGQACVLYDNKECIGSGIIKEVYKNNQKIWYL